MKQIFSTRTVDVVFARLRDAILTGEIPPGSPLYAQVLAKQLGVSHIPVREALCLLQGEGLIVSAPRRTPVVADAAIEQLAEIYELRSMVELPTARRAVKRSTSDDVERVWRKFERFENLSGDPMSVEYWESHHELHRAVIAAGATQWTYRVLEPLWRASERYVRLFVKHFEPPNDALAMHRSLVEAYESGVPDTLVEALSKHFEETQYVIRVGYERATTTTALSHT